MSASLNPKEIAAKAVAEAEQRAKELSDKGAKPGLAFVLVGDNPASHTYVNLKKDLCAKIGIDSRIEKLPEDSSTADVVKAVRALNEDPKWHAILVQLPLPKKVIAAAVLDAIDPRKDVDGLHPLNQGLLACGLEYQPIPCTPRGIMRLIREAGVDPKGKRAVVVGRSRIVGRPMEALLLNAGASSVTVCHRGTKNLMKECLQADILVVAAGSRKLVDGNMVKEGALVIDVGINHIDGKIVGDVEAETVGPKATLTPVPGGVGPMTLAMLMKNTVELADRHLMVSEAG